MRGQAKAPMMPEPMEVMDKRAMAIVLMCSSVFAKSTAVPEIVATASERRNQEMRKMRVWRRRTAFLRVAQKLLREKDV